MEPKAATTWKYLAVDPLASFTQLSIVGRRIRARTLCGMYMSAEEPRSREEIAEACPGLYHRDNRRQPPFFVRRQG